MHGFPERPWWPSDGTQLRESLRYWIANHLDPAATVRVWWRHLADAGLTAPTWPRIHGGLGVTTRVQEIIESELAAAGAIAPPVDHDGFRAIAPVLRQLLPADQLVTWLEPLLRGEHTWALLVDEPGREAGDVACRADVDWKYTSLHGAKLAPQPTTHALVMTRSDPASTGLKGLTCWMVDLREPGITAADGTVTFAEHRFLHDRALGTQGNGWDVARLVQPFLERTLAGRIRRGLVHVPAGDQLGALDRTVAEAIASYRPAPPPGVERRRQA